VPHLRGVVNLIQGPGRDPNPARQRVLQPRRGQNVYATDIFLGRVERMIISPRHRRVSAIVVRGNPPDPERADTRAQLGDSPPQERWIVIPIEVVHDVTEAEVMLTISGVDAARCRDFDPNDFVAPDPKWQPPYPYAHADILLDLGRADAAPSNHRAAISADVLAAEPGPEGQPLWERITRGMPVIFRDGLVGKVDHMWVDPLRGSVSRIIVRAGGPLPKDTAIPLDWVRRIDETGIFVEVGAEQLAALPEAAWLPVPQAQPAGKP
jgi:sporulation protein YlmC with PRC-barrel domain